MARKNDALEEKDREDAEQEDLVLVPREEYKKLEKAAEVGVSEYKTVEKHYIYPAISEKPSNLPIGHNPGESDAVESNMPPNVIPRIVSYSPKDSSKEREESTPGNEVTELPPLSEMRGFLTGITDKTAHELISESRKIDEERDEEIAIESDE